jgi:hypothetical protein
MARSKPYGKFFINSNNINIYKTLLRVRIRKILHINRAGSYLLPRIICTYLFSHLLKLVTSMTSVYKTKGRQYQAIPVTYRVR